ncbi:MAG: enoyl-CoA hydratase-related protein [Dehalococcoidia bacterium]|nr:enoyl-CoA hydratase-related protein [Dehalococcoidia bacterium]
MSEPRIIVEKANAVAKVTINRPEKHNAMDLQFFREFGPRIDELSQDAEVRVIILTGAGRSFCSGIDLVGLAEVARDSASATVLGQSLSEPFGPLQSVPRSLRACRKPVIAAVNGFASGMGMSLLCLCDYRIASEQASFAPGFIRMGLAGEFGITYILPRLIGFPFALKFLSEGETRDARWAERVGLVEEVVPAGDLMEAAQRLAAKLATMPPIALGMVKELLYQGLESNFDYQLQSEAYAASILLRTEDFQEAVRAFLEKRPPVFKGR